MTRFARAKGSKSSNERVPEEATPWRQMKQQLLEKEEEVKDAIERRKFEKKRTENYQAFLNEKDEDERKNTKWAEFPEEPFNVKKKTEVLKKKKIKLSTEGVKKKKDKLSNGPKNSETIQVEENMKKEQMKETGEKIKRKLIKKKPQVTEQTAVPKIKKKKLQNDSQKNDDVKETKTTSEKGTKRKKLQNDSQQNDETKSTSEKGTKRKSEDTSNEEIPNKTQKINENSPDEDLKKIEKKKEKKLRQLEKRKLNKPPKSIGPLHKNNKKPKEGEKHRRKPQQTTMIYNGKEIEIAYLDGFPIKKEDFIRIQKLRKEMISKGLPRSEINTSLKLERRKAEKNLARERKKVCFNCRQSGHNLSECPQLEKQQDAIGTGVCFKCGSTEHTHFECKVIKGQEFRFAQCFICNEQGHIARQCPDNARGLYPKGGACKVCGDVTHLKKDCPQYQQQQEQQNDNYQAEIMDTTRNPDDFIGDGKHEIKGGHQRVNKIIKF